ncbi:protein mono-ADP-ribosyltransferase PARP14 isoform X3 [Ctenopharyngodon idella]|uniref:protein mono-ADP-ribosyltransferase PARP14 isoform X3 n=1 Tax=Ctenopharyngodon idella TaxID=7959 RepID=UPI0022307E8A|nr:protein mono-ADP-ribosyltransferase PARP14 isoform X3 [Ctenopharyngodon idella]
MDEYPIIVEGDWGPEHTKSVKNKLHIHFQSKKKSQGGDCVVQYNDKSNSATILFKSPYVRDAVLSQAEHIITIDSKQIKLKVFKPSDVEEQADNTGQKTQQACGNQKSSQDDVLSQKKHVITTESQKEFKSSDAEKQADSTGQRMEQASGYQEPNQSVLQTNLDVKKPQESSAVVLEDLPDDFNQDVLTLLVENITSLSENDFGMELIPELRKAVVTFKNLSDAGKFLVDSRTHEKFKKNNLRARALERSTCVRVENLTDEASTNKMLLELYFEKWGGPVEEIITNPSEQAAIITFKEEEARERVLKRENNICDVPVKIYPYFKSLDTVLYGGNRPHLKLPDPITVSVHPAIRELLLKKGEISSIKCQMSSHFCQINMDKPEALLSPDPALLKQKGVTRRHVDGWSKNACDAFMKIISKYTTSEWPVSHPLWSKVESDVKELVKDKVFTDMDASKGVLTLAGMTHEIIGLKLIMEKILERATNHMEREKNSVTEQMEMSPAMYSLLLQDGLKSAVSPHLHIDYNKKMNRLNLSGLHTETLTFKNWVLEKKINMKQKPLKIDRSILEFLRSVDCNEMSTDLFISHGITAVYTIENGDVVLTGSTEKALVEAEKRVNMVLTSKDLIIEDQGVLQMPEWQDLKKQLQKSFNTSKNISVLNLSQRDKVIVTGFRDPVMKVSESLGRFIEKHTKIEETVRVKSHAVVEFIKDRKTQDWQHIMKSDKIKVKFDSKRPWIKLSGERGFVQPAMTFFKRLADSLHTDTHIIKKAGAKKYFKEQGKMMLSMLLKEKRFVVVLQEDDMLEQEEDEFTESSFEDFGQVSCEVRMPSGVTVTVRMADICKLSVDAVVNAANEDLKHIGGLAFALLQAAGPRLQHYCEHYIKENGPLKPGDAIITDAGRLRCKYVVHAVGPRFSDSDRRTTVQRLRHAIRESLNKASSKNCSSIAIPVISSGIFGCPLELCTESIAKEVCEYIENQNRRGSSSTLTEIQLVDNNGSTVNAMAQAVRKEFAAYNPKINFPHQSKPHGYSNDRQGYRGSGHGSGRGRGHGNGYRGHGNYGHRNQEFEGPKVRGNREFEGQAHSSSGGRSDTFEGLSVLETKTTKEGLKIILSKGNIQDARADVIVNTISEDLDLSKGAVSKALLQTAGHQLQSEITTAARSNNLNYGEMVITDGYKLKCRKVFHVVSPFWKQGSADRVLIQIIRDCLRKAETRGMASVVFPAIGTGNLGFPKDLVAKIMLTEFQEFNSTNLREVTVIVHPSDKESIQCFTSIFRNGIQGPNTKGPDRLAMNKTNISGKSAQTSGIVGKVSSPSLGVHTMHLGQVTLEVSSGDITKEKTDAIVNSSNPTFSLKAGVSKAILDAAGLQVEQECSQIVGSSNIQQTEIVTSAGHLPCGKIIHIIGRNGPSEIKDVVLSVLKLCESRQITSVAFPALGTGQGGAPPADVADAMVDAVVDFVKKKKPVHVKFVKFLIFQTNMLSDFHQSMVRRSGEKVEEDKSLFTKIKDYFLGESSESPKNDEFVMVVEEIEPAVFQLCGETSEDLREAKDMIHSFIVREHMTIPIHDPAIADFTKGDAEMLNSMQREFTVSIKLEKKGRDSVVTLEGLTRDVHSAERRIRDMIRKVERNESQRREAFIVSSMVNWQYQENGRNLKNFDMLTNYELEQAYQKRQPSVRIKINNDDYEADLFRKEATRGRMRIELNRVDLKDAAAAAAQSPLPSHWEDMKLKSVVLVKLTAGSNEYNEVEKEFRRTNLTSNIIEIETVQNSALWRNYMIKKEEMEEKNKHKNNEKRLFHGTGPDKTDQINHHGFNRSFSGMHGAIYGNGTYFAVDPSYSARGYSNPYVRGVKRMYLARVLVGDFTQGKQGLPVPPRKSSNSADLYNSVTDNINNPSMFVVFNDVQAYPEYLITFQ